MKKIVFLFLLAVASLNIQAQNYRPLLDSVNSWCFVSNYFIVNAPDTSFYGPCYYPYGGMNSGSKLYTTADTLINGVIFKLLESTDYYFNDVCRYGYIREDTAARKVYFMNNMFSPEILIYDFSMQINDTINMPFYFSPGYYESGTYRLDSVHPFITATGFTTKAYYLNCVNCSFSNHTVEWIEGIGTRGGLVLPYNDNSQGGGQFGWCGPGGFNTFPYDFSLILINFEHKNRLFYDSCVLASVINNPCYEYHDTCSYWNICGSVNEFDAGSFIKIQPNPSLDKINITTKQDINKPVNFIIKDMTGKPVYKSGTIMFTVDKPFSINISILRDGIYILECHTAAGHAYEKFVKTGK